MWVFSSYITILFLLNQFLSPILPTLSYSVMKKLLLSCDMDVMLEATRVFGNLTQSKDVRDFIVQSKGENIFLKTK